MNRFLTSCVLLISACTSSELLEGQPVAWLPPDIHLKLRGTLALSEAGELTLALAEPCRFRYVVRRSLHMLGEVTCDRDQLDRIPVVATTPWHRQVAAVWTDPAHLVFRVDWSNTGLDPLADDTDASVAQPWTISGIRWTPSTMQARRIAQLISKANRDDDFEVVSGGLVPDLEVTVPPLDHGALRAGGDSPLTVRIANVGPGTAYRVVVTTRSSLASLHRHHLDFGRIEPGATKTRQLRLHVPVSETSPDAMLVLVVTEGNGFSPHHVHRRLSIAPPTIAPVLAVHCSIPRRRMPTPELDAGEELVLCCWVDNSGTAATQVMLDTWITGELPWHSAVQRIPPGGHARFKVPVTIPHDLSIDSMVAITVFATDHTFRRVAHTRVVGTIRRPALCTPGQLTPTQYQVKVAELRAELAAGDLTQAQFDQYDAELVTCLW
jgi:hypothetical protein